jgi:hypothetical protein
MWYGEFFSWLARHDPGLASKAAKSSKDTKIRKKPAAKSTGA